MTLWVGSPHHNPAKFGVHRPYETGNNHVCNIIIIIIIIIITFIQYMKQVQNYKSRKNGLFKPGKKYIYKKIDQS